MKTTKERLIVWVLAAMLVLGALALAGCDRKSDTTTPPADNGGGQGGSGQEPAQPAEDIQAVLEEQCTVCHSVARIYLQPDATNWESVITKMDIEHGKTHGGEPLGLSAERRSAIIEFMKTRTRTEGEKIVRTKCVDCHDLAKLTKQTADADWAAIIKRMVEEHGAKLTVAEQQNALNFLQGN